jgi:arylsulfatase A-like enzyme
MRNWNARFWIIAFTCWLGVECSGATRPNVLLILSDDQGYGDFGVTGNRFVETPVLDKFARTGIQFDRFFVSPVCAPSRASVLTGRWWLRTGVWGVTQSRENMRPSEVTLAEAFKPAGYRTGCFGKWHNGEQFPYTAPGQGFDEFLGFNNGHWNNYVDAELIRGSQFVKTKGFVADVLTDEAIAFIEKNKAQPFFCYVPFNLPHAPFQVPDKYFNKYKAKGLDDVLSAVYGMCENIDDNVGRLLATLERLKLRENTIVLYFSDNGANTDRYNAGMRGRKGSVHEGGTRVPLWVQWPARFKEPRVINQISTHIDLYPTLLELCGVKLPPGPKIDGVSLVPLLDGKSANWPERILFSHQSSGARPEMGKRDAVRTQRFRAVREASNQAADDNWQLYDMVDDPGEKTNIARSHPELVKRLVSAYTNWFHDVTSAGFARPMIPVGYEEQNPVRLYAPQSSFTGKIRFFADAGFANDWLTGWTSLEDKISFQLDVVRPGFFEVELAYACASENAGSKIRVSAGTNCVETTTAAAPAPQIPLPHRDRGGKTYVNRNWGTLKAGRLYLDNGPISLRIEALSKPHEEILELKHVQLRRVN